MTIREIIRTGGLPHPTGLPHQPGVPNLLVNRPLVVTRRRHCANGLLSLKTKETFVLFQLSHRPWKRIPACLLESLVYPWDYIFLTFA